MAVSAKEREPRTSKKKRLPSVLEQLIAGCDAERVAVQFVDGRHLEGALLFNPIKRSGKLINVDQEFSLDFHPFDVKEIRVLSARSFALALDRPDVATPRDSRPTEPLGQDADEDD